MSTPNYPPYGDQSQNPQQPGYGQQGSFPPADPTNPYGQPTYPPQQPSYPPPSQPGYPPQQPGYPPQQPGYPPQAPGYPPPQGYGYGGGYPPPPMPPKSSNRTLWWILGIVGGLVILACVGCGIIFAITASKAGSIIGPAVTVATFCEDEATQDYTGAYTELSSNLQGQVSQNQFVTANQTRDSSSGTVQSCTTSSSGGDTSIGDTSATFDLQVTLSDGSTHLGKITLAKDGSSWKIDSLDSSLQLGV